ncbi:hypothetical protein CHL67_01735 [Prosthecochloris sp. GSB1]|uniref:AAA family ATPase n=1 Tax=Prosthecochloris sp. GSB1 TaxID=281093 RepID=UPI000B8CFBF6|nr:AAA family ATPase [Prosthecochloris sp. GSB1]ASQ89810.1 hypothetical protein CHL67_01735 [Prosthecochloris sp. GSB1]
MSPDRYIITGGPGSGKSTLLEELKRQGYHCFEEASRRIIRREAARQSGILPWKNLLAFSKMAVEAMIRQHERSSVLDGVCFFDRGLPDVFGYLRNAGLDVPAGYRAALAACRYRTEVFVLPPWEEIFVQDSERPQTWDESVSLYRSLCEVYSELGFRLFEVPRGSVWCRARYLESVVGAAMRKADATK